jgi:hypothetical protein
MCDSCLKYVNNVDLLLPHFGRWAFSIWGIIFALQGAGAIYAALPMGYQSPAKRAAVNTIGTRLELQRRLFVS